MGKNVKKTKAKTRSNKKTVDGITFRSELEVYMYKALKQAGIEHGYETHKYTLLSPLKYEEECWEKPKGGKQMKDNRTVRAITYTPDFVGEKEEWIIETKGWENDAFPLKWKMFKQLMMERESPPILFKPKTQKECNQVVDTLLSKGYGKEKKQRYVNVGVKKKIVKR